MAAFGGAVYPSVDRFDGRGERACQTKLPRDAVGGGLIGVLAEVDG